MADPEIMTEAQAAAALRVAAKTLARWRIAGRGPGYDRTPGGRIRYRWQDLIAFRQSMRVSSQVPICSNMSGETEVFDG